MALSGIESGVLSWVIGAPIRRALRTVARWIVVGGAILNLVMIFIAFANNMSYISNAWYLVLTIVFNISIIISIAFTWSVYSREFVASAVFAAILIMMGWYAPVYEKHDEVCDNCPISITTKANIYGRELK